ncbi:MAG: hypothetical protein QHH18_02330 [Candidatus Bathyarchaeota archaeon]|jgi:CO dehydrogenase/acetyl-CoA synthase delta subunit|nr:hypothetical protein [Candidatus Bathyarchaeota archaeon A05DMB-5]MDH7557431.1 hypothetical protein [Candidatus Bathyarchaeota archaeon]
MKTEEIKTKGKVINELNESYFDLIQGMKGTIREVKTAKQQWKDGNKSRLIKLGLALIVFPEPTPISETIGSFLVAAGMVQKGIRNQAIYIEDIGKTFQNTLREIRTTTDALKEL